MSLQTKLLGIDLDGTPPDKYRTVGLSAILQAFALAFDVVPPKTEDLSADQVLNAFREFTAACMEAVRDDEQLAGHYRARLREEAFSLAVKLRRALGVGKKDAFKLVRYCYRGLEIEVEGNVPGDINFVACSFAQRYTPADCWLMSGFDEGFICGIADCENGELAFSSRLTEGAPQCAACLKS